MDGMAQMSHHSLVCQVGTFPGDCSTSEDGKREPFSSRTQAETLPRVVLTESCCQWGQVAKAVKEGLGRVASRCFPLQLGHQPQPQPPQFPSCKTEAIMLQAH